MCRIMEGVVSLKTKKALGAHEARVEWCQCADELGKMVKWEAKNNPRYKDVQMYFSHELSSPPTRKPE